MRLDSDRIGSDADADADADPTALTFAFAFAGAGRTRIQSPARASISRLRRQEACDAICSQYDSAGRARALRMNK